MASSATFLPALQVEDRDIWYRLLPSTFLSIPLASAAFIMTVSNSVFSAFSFITFILVLIPFPWHLEGTSYFSLTKLRRFIYFLILVNSLEYRNMLIHALDCIRPTLLFY